MADEQHPARHQDSLGKWDDVVPVFVVNGDEVGGGGSGGTGLTDAELRAAPVPVSGPLTDAQLRASPVPVVVSGEVEFKNDSGNPIPVSGPLTDAQLRASALPLPSGAATAAKQDAAATLFGPLNEGAPANDTDASGLNGRLQRIAQRITSLIALLPASLGAKTGANSLSVVPASDGNFKTADGGNVAIGATADALATDTASAWSVVALLKGILLWLTRSTSATNRSGTIATGGQSQQLMAANPARRGWAIQNQSSGDLYVSGTGAATLDQNSMKLIPGAYYESPNSISSQVAHNIIGATTGQAFWAREW
jgi:hypothetical protein